MPLIPDPCFIESIRARSGPKRVLVHITNGSPEAVALKIENVEKPDYVDVERAMIGDTLSLKKSGKLPLVVNINTEHRFFPSEDSAQEQIKFEFDNGEVLTVFLYLQEIINTVETFRGTFSIDFGTTNSCYASKGRVGDDFQMSDALKPPQVSREIPTLIRFVDISDRAHPKIEIGHQARDYIAHNSGRNFTYCISIKRLIGSEKDVIILDDRSGLEADRYQAYKPYEIAGFILKELIRQAEQELGQQIENVVATFPILYNRQKLENLRKAFQIAFDGLGRPWNDDRLILRVDETNAATFNYIYGQLLDDFRRFSTQESQHRLVSYDFGGGTVDVAVTDVDLKRDESGRIRIETDAMGLTGDAYFGGDNITLSVLKVLKLKLVKRIADHLSEAKTAAKEDAASQEQEQAEAANPWALPAVEEQKTVDDPWGALASDQEQASENTAAAVEEDDEDPETADIANLTPEAQTERAIDTLMAHGDVLEAAINWGMSPLEALERLVTSGVKAGVQAFEVKEIGFALTEAIDTLLPTCWQTLENKGDLIAKDVAKKLFYELWLPAEVLKIRAVTTDERQAALTQPLKKIAKYAGVRTEDLMGLSISEAEINAAINRPLRRSIAKAAYLVQHVEGDAAPDGGSASKTVGLDFGFGEASQTTSSGNEGRRLTVLLAGNSSRLPIVKTLAAEIFQVDQHAVVMDPGGVKAAVAQGACEEHILRRDFGGEGGLIQYLAGDFVERSPFTVGLFQKELSLVGYKGGFAPVLPRGTKVGTQVLISDNLPILHKDSTELTLFGWYHDHELGADPGMPGFVESVEPRNLGWFDLTAPENEGFQGRFNEEVMAQLAGLPETSFALVLELDHDQNLRLINPRSTSWYRLKVAAEPCLDDENPFSGIH